MQNTEIQNTNRQEVNSQLKKKVAFLASQDALEVMYVSESLSQWSSEWAFSDLTNVTLVSDDAF